MGVPNNAPYRPRFGNHEKLKLLRVARTTPGRYVAWLRRRPDMVNVLGNYTLRVQARMQDDEEMKKVLDLKAKEDSRRDSLDSSVGEKPMARRVGR